MEAKYFNNMHPIKAQWSRGQPQSWKVLCNIKEEVDKNIIWIIGRGEVDFWYDNWTNISPLYLLFPDNVQQQQISIKDVYIDGMWDWDKLHNQPDADTKDKIRELNIVLHSNRRDKDIWIPNTNGNFTIKSSWSNYRQRSNSNNFIKNIWHKDIPFKISFLNWRVIRDKLSTNERVSGLIFKLIVPAIVVTTTL
ncbi:hypothetical protein KY285_007612 [Solanum tuberosum]|nr:hypothetical protein KY285_007612 [Solanum tuberosum]